MYPYQGCTLQSYLSLLINWDLQACVLMYTAHSNFQSKHELVNGGSIKKRPLENSVGGHGSVYLQFYGRFRTLDNFLTSFTKRNRQTRRPFWSIYTYLYFKEYEQILYHYLTH